MKRICYIIICLIFIFSFIDVLSAEENIYIKSLEIDDLSINAIEKTEPMFDGNVVNFDLEFREVGDYIKYKVVVHNSTNKEYYIKENTGFSDSNSIIYKYLAESSIRANSDSVIYLVISYDNEVNNDLFVENKYGETNKAILELVDDKGVVIKNPKTGNGSFIVIGLLFLLIISCLVLFIMNKKGINRSTFIFIICIINFIPLLVSAKDLLMVELNINVSIQTGGYHVIYNPVFNETLVNNAIINKFDIINNVESTCESLYFEGNNYEPNYVWCSYGPLLKSKKMYMPGEKVEVAKIDTYKFSSDFEPLLAECDISDDETSGVCPLYLEYVLLSPSDKSDLWIYNEKLITKAGYTFLENDFDVMNFSILGSYNSVFPYSTFTMPEHDVYFYPNFPM